MCSIQPTKRFERPLIFPYVSARALSAMQPFLPLVLIYSQILAFLKGCIGDIGYYVEHI